MDSFDHSVKVLVSGAGGYIGRSVCKRLAASGFQVVAVSSSLREMPACQVVHCTTLDGLVKVASDLSPDYLVHLAAFADGQGLDRSTLMSVNVALSCRLAHAAMDGGKLKRFVFMSSAKVMGETGEWANESTTPTPQTDYAESKWLAEQELAKLRDLYGLPLSILRPALVYGAGVKGSLGALLSLRRRSCWPRLPETTGERSMVSNDDLAAAIEICLREPSVLGKALFVSDGLRYRMSEIDDAIRKFLLDKTEGWRLPVGVLHAAAITGDLLNSFGVRLPFNSHQLRSFMSTFIVESRTLMTSTTWRPTQSLYEALPYMFRIGNGRCEP